MADEYLEVPSEATSPVSRWDAELRAYEKAAKNWYDDCKRIVKRYSLADKSGDIETDMVDDPQFNILWSNIETTRPAIFARQPVPVVERRFQDQDPIGRIASQVLERAIETELESDDFLETGKRLTLDVLLCGRGVPWVRYEADMRTMQGEDDDEPQDVVASEMSPIDYVHWRDFAHKPCKTWNEVQRKGWVAKRVSMTRAELKDRFGDIGDKVPVKAPGSDDENESNDEGTPETMKTAEVWEIWDRGSGKAIWICREYKDQVLDEDDPPVDLENFFPCPRPAYGTLTNESLIPVPDYLQYEDLAHELDDTTRRISVLVEALEVRGVYDASMENLGRLVDEMGTGNKLYSVSNLADLLGKGSAGGTLRNVIQLFPVDVIAQALIGLYDARDRTKQTLFEVSGVADIIRGQVDPREKLGQSQLKGRFASQRLDQRRTVVENAARDTIRIKAEIMAEQYSPETLRALSGYDQMGEVVKLRRSEQAGEAPPGAADQVFAQAIELLRSEKLRGFRIDVETDSTIALDEQGMKDDRAEFLSAMGGFMTQGLEVATAVPELAPAVGEMMLFTARGYKVGRSLESTFEEAVDRMREAAENPPEPQPDPEAEANAQAAQAKAQEATVKAQTAQQMGQLKLVETQAKTQAMAQKAQLDLQTAEGKAYIEQQKVSQQLEAELIKTQMELQALEAKYAMERRNQLEQVAQRDNG